MRQASRPQARMAQPRSVCHWPALRLPLTGGKRLTAIMPAVVGYHRDSRRSTISRRKRLVSAATVNHELACLKRMVNVACKGLIALRGGIPALNPIASVSLAR
jgi:hypothetical protein